MAADDQSRVIRPQELVRNVLPELHPGAPRRQLTTLNRSRV